MNNLPNNYDNYSNCNADSDLNKDIYLDTETAPIEHSALAKLAIKTIQLNQDIYHPVKDKVIVEEKFKGDYQGVYKHLIAFNAPFDQTQLHHAGYNIWKNRWSDVSLMARLSDNLIVEKGVFSLEDTETTFLGTTTKRDYVTQLTEKYGKNFFAHPKIESEPLFQAYSLNDTRVTQELYHHLKSKVPTALNQVLQELSTKHSKWQARGIPFPREKIEQKCAEMRAKLLWTLDKIVDIDLNKKKPTQLKGWKSSTAINKYIRKYKPEWLEYLEETKATKKIKFRGDDRDRLIEHFPNDETLKLAYKLLLQNHIIKNYEELLKFSDGNILRPQFMLLGAASGRFTSSKPGLHNLKTKPPTHIFDPTETPADYNVRNILFKADNVFSIDLSNQEDRMSAKLADEDKDIQAFIEGRKLHQEMADELNVSYDQAKKVRHGCRYGRRPQGLSKGLGVSISEAERIYLDYQQKYRKTFEFSEGLRNVESITTPPSR